MTIDEMQSQAWENAEVHGFHEDLNIPTKLLLIIEEVTEAFAEIRDGNNLRANHYRDSDRKPEGFPAEIADIVIRCADLAGIIGFDLEATIVEKMAFNKTRPFKHGRQL